MYEKIDIETFVVQITDECNLNCKHCFLSGGKPGEMSRAFFEKIIQEAIRLNVREISISGGEPLMHPDILEIMDVVTRYPQTKFGLVTNGTMLDERFMEIIEQNENLYVQISVDGSKKETYERIRGKGTFPALWNGLELLAKSKIKDKRARTAVNQINYEDVYDICECLYERGIMPSFLPTSIMGNAVDHREELELTDAKKMKANVLISQFNKLHGCHINKLYPTGSCSFVKGLERKAFTIDADGQVYACDYLHDMPIGNLLSDSLENMLHGELIRKIYEMGTKRLLLLEQNAHCQKCGVKNECGYGCLAEARHDAMDDGRDRLCNYRKLFYGCEMARLI